MPQPGDNLEAQIAQAAQGQPAPTGGAEGTQVPDRSGEDPAQPTIEQLIAAAANERSQRVNAEQERDAAREMLAHMPAQPAPANPLADPFDELERRQGIDRAPLQSAIDQRTDTRVTEQLQQILGPMVNKAKAVDDYKKVHADYDQVAHDQFVASNPDVQVFIQDAETKGAYGAAVEYAELRRKISDAASKQETQVSNMNQNKQTAGVMSGSAGSGVDPKANQAGITADELSNIVINADSGQWQPFVDKFMDDLPSEEEFQRIARS